MKPDPGGAEQAFEVLAAEYVSVQELIFRECFTAKDERQWPLDMVVQRKGLQARQNGRWRAA